MYDEANESILKTYSPEEVPLSIRHEVYQFLALLANLKEDYRRERELLLNSLSFLEGSLYSRYVTELSIGEAYRKTGQQIEARFWLIQSLKTVLDDPTTNGCTAIQLLLEITEGHLSRHEKRLCEQVALHSWHVHDLPGEPDTTDWEITLKALSDAMCMPRRPPEDQEKTC